MTPPISDIHVYVHGMEKSLQDKLFFVPLINDKAKYILDYGCADGKLLKSVSDRYVGVGYDECSKMVELGLRNGVNVKKKFDNALLEVNPKQTILNLSSVIHEVYSYCDDQQVEEFWNRVFASGFEYISIRDMSVSKDIGNTTFGDFDKIWTNYNHSMIKQFTNIFGTFTSKKNLIHFLLKYRYTENWEREVRGKLLASHCRRSY